MFQEIFFRMLIFRTIYVLHTLESCSLKWLTSEKNMTCMNRPWDTADVKLSNVDNKLQIQNYQNTSRIMNVTADEAAQGVLQNQTQPRKSSRWDQFHRFPQTIEEAPGKIHRMIEATKRLLDPFQIAKVVMESVPEAVKKFAWYVVIGMASTWALFIFVIFVCVTGKLMVWGRCLMKNSGRGIGATKGCFKKIYEKAGKQNNRHELIQQNP